MPTLNFLKYAAAVNNGFIHSFSRKATTALIGLLNPQPGDNILEIGCGAGFTAISVVLACKGKIHLSATDILPEMIERAKKNATHFGVSNQINFSLSKPGEKLPFEDHSFDKIYWESVLAIQDPDHYRFFLGEARRLLKPAGMCLMNETIWLPDISQQSVDEVNNYNLVQFGLPASTQLAWSSYDWETAFKSEGFSVVKNELVEEIIRKEVFSRDLPDSTRFQFRLAWLKSVLLKYLVPSLAIQNYRMKLKMKKFNHLPRHLEARFFILRTNN